MNPNPVRLPFDIEVCGLELIETRNKGPFDFGFIAGVSADLTWTNDEIVNLFKITNSKQCPIEELKLMDLNSEKELNANYKDRSIFMNPVVNGTEEGLTIKNNIKVDTTFSFSLLARTWGNVTVRQDFNIAWYVNKPPTFPSKPKALIIDVDYDNV